MSDLHDNQLQHDTLLAKFLKKQIILSVNVMKEAAQLKSKPIHTSHVILHLIHFEELFEELALLVLMLYVYMHRIFLNFSDYHRIRIFIFLLYNKKSNSELIIVLIYYRILLLHLRYRQVLIIN